MTVEFTVIALAAFFTCILISIFYWKVFYPVVLKALQFRLFARRDKLRSLLIHNDGAAASTFAYQHLEAFICKCVSVVPVLNLLTFIAYAVKHHNDAPHPNAARFKAESNPALRALNQETIRDSLLIMVLNSPIMFILIGGLGFLLWAFGKLYKVYSRAESLVTSVPDTAPQMA